MATRRQFLLALGAGAALTAPGVELARAAGPRRIGFLLPATREGFDSRVEALRAGLRELGHVEGKSIAYEYRAADGKYERLTGLAAQLVRLKVDMIVTYGPPAIQGSDGDDPYRHDNG